MEIRYTSTIPDAEELYELYENDGWNAFLKLPKELLHNAMKNSWYVISAYHENHLIGTGRIISDGVINGYLCGLIVHPNYRNQGIGKVMVRKLVDMCSNANLHIQLFSDEKNASYYEKLGFEDFAVGMKNSRI